MTTKTKPQRPGPKRPIPLGSLVDQLGTIKAQIADLEKEEKRLVLALADSKATVAEGHLFRATISRFTVHHCDYRHVVESLEQTPQLRRLITRNTKDQDRTTVKVVARC